MEDGSTAWTLLSQLLSLRRELFLTRGKITKRSVARLGGQDEMGRIKE